jgi:dienelactone hydrolase
MSNSNRQLAFPLALLLVFVCGAVFKPVAAKEKQKLTKSIRGIVTDTKENAISGARVFIRNVKKNTTAVLVTDEKGVFSIYGLDPQFDYEVHAEKGGLSSAFKTVSSFLERKDTALSLVLVEKGSGNTRSQLRTVSQSVEVVSSDGTRFIGDWYQPTAKPDRALPTVLFLPDYGEDKKVWESFIQDLLLKNNFAALVIDLLGRGTNDGTTQSFSPQERQKLVESKRLLHDLAAVMQWLRAKETVDSGRIAVVGTGLGASLAFVASGRFDDICSSVAILPDFKEAQALSAGIENFQPHSILYVAFQTGSPGEASARQLEKITGFPVRLQVYEDSQVVGSKVLQAIPAAAELLISWLKNTL